MNVLLVFVIIVTITEIIPVIEKSSKRRRSFLCSGLQPGLRLLLYYP